MPDYNTLKESSINLYPELNMGLSYSGESSEFTGSFTLSGNYDFTNTNDISNYLSSIINEAYLKTFMNGFNLEAGFMKIIWGKGDEIFTFDNINAVDYSDFMNKPYLDRKKAEAMIKVNIPFGQMGLLEALYTPVFTPDTYPDTGNWVQEDYKTMETLINTKITGYIQPRVFQILAEGETSQTAALLSAQSEAAALAANVLNKENTNTLGHSQAGIHITDSFGGVDWGVSYEYTYLREPVVNMTAFLTDPTQKIDISYDRLNLFGLEAAAALGGLNFRAEGAYYLTADTKGTDPIVHNNKIQYLAGFDTNIPLHNLSLNIQARGEIILATDSIKDNSLSDIEYSADDSYLSTIIGADIRDTYFNDNLTLKVSGAYSVGSKDYMITPGLDYTIQDNAMVKINYSLYRGDSDTLFGQFKDNDMVEVIFQYTF